MLLRRGLRGVGGVGVGKAVGGVVGGDVGGVRGVGTAFRLEEVEKALNTPHPWNNVPENVKSRVGRRLLHVEQHPLWMLKRLVADFWGVGGGGGWDSVPFRLFDDLSPVVSVRQNFDELLTPADHVSRSPSDTYYLSDAELLRCHTSAHQTELLRAGERAFLVAGDVYRRDTVDRTHSPVFHQLEGVRVFGPEEVGHLGEQAREEYVVTHLKGGLEAMVRKMFGADAKLRWVDESFPFTDPSFELEVEFQGEWLEVLGCGVIARGVLDNAGIDKETVGWAFGLGLERLAMRLFDIPDIRLFWSTDPRFLSQFQGAGTDVTFKPYSKFPPCYKDVAFWIPQNDAFHLHDVFETIRNVAGDLVEDVECIDEFTHPKTGRTSHCYRINYRSMDRSLTNQEVDALQDEVREHLQTKLNLELR